MLTTDNGRTDIAMTIPRRTTAVAEGVKIQKNRKIFLEIKNAQKGTYKTCAPTAIWSLLKISGYLKFCIFLRFVASTAKPS